MLFKKKKKEIIKEIPTNEHICALKILEKIEKNIHNDKLFKDLKTEQLKFFLSYLKQMKDGILKDNVLQSKFKHHKSKMLIHGLYSVPWYVVTIFIGLKYENLINRIISERLGSTGGNAFCFFMESGGLFVSLLLIELPFIIGLAFAHLHLRITLTGLTKNIEKELNKRKNTDIISTNKQVDPEKQIDSNENNKELEIQIDEFVCLIQKLKKLIMQKQISGNYLQIINNIEYNYINENCDLLTSLKHLIELIIELLGSQYITDNEVDTLNLNDKNLTDFLFNNYLPNTHLNIFKYKFSNFNSLLLYRNIIDSLIKINEEKIKEPDDKSISLNKIQ